MERITRSTGASNCLSPSNSAAAALRGPNSGYALHEPLELLPVHRVVASEIRDDLDDGRSAIVGSPGSSHIHAYIASRCPQVTQPSSVTAHACRCPGFSGHISLGPKLLGYWFCSCAIHCGAGGGRVMQGNDRMFPRPHSVSFQGWMRQGHDGTHSVDSSPRTGDSRRLQETSHYYGLALIASMMNRIPSENP